MKSEPAPVLISSIDWKFIRSYYTGKTSLFRMFQWQFMERCGKELTGVVVELGCEKHYQHERFFPSRSGYRCTNIARDFDDYLDVTRMDTLADASQDAFVAVSLLEHVPDFEKALSEITRTLKPGGQLLIAVPFLYEVHDEVDFFRFAPDWYRQHFKDYDIRVFAHLGGRLSTIANLLQRPRGYYRRPRYFLKKTLGLPFVILAKYYEALDAAPLGFGIYAVKRGTSASE